MKDNAGNPVFTVYSDAVEVTIPESADKSNHSGRFLVSGRSIVKGTDTTYFMVTPDSTRVFLKDPDSKGVSGGFAVGRYGTAKGVSSIFSTNEDSTRIYTNAVNKGISGGFAVGRYGTAKGGVNYIDITPDNMFIGEEAGANTTSLYNSFFGFESGQSNVAGANNVFIGYQSGKGFNQGTENIFIGPNSGSGITNTGSKNIFMGHQSGMNNGTGASNIFMGTSAGLNNNNGGNNVFLGFEAGSTNSVGNYNVFLGNQAGALENGSDKLYIENSGADNTVSLIYGEFDNDILRLNGTTGIKKYPGENNSITNLALDINGNFNVDGDFYQNGLPVSLNNPWLINGTKIYYNTDNVGIGLNNPNTPLHIRDNNDVSNLNILTLEHNTPTAGDNDVVNILFSHTNDASSLINYATIGVSVTDVSAGTEDASIIFNAMNNGTMQEALRINGNGTTEINIASVTTVNASTVNADNLNVNGRIMDKTGFVMPVGSIMPFAGTSAPTGWLICDGSAIDRTAYDDLYAVIVNNWGEGNGSTTFNLPDLRGQFLRGRDNGAGNDQDAGTRTNKFAGGSTGDVVGSYQEDVFQDHTHSINTYAGEGTIGEYAGNTKGYGTTYVGTDIKTNSAFTGNVSTETRPKNAYVNYIIKY